MMKLRLENKAQKRLAIISGIAFVFVAVLLLIPVLMPFDPNVTNLSYSLVAPGEAGYLLGSDSVGRDVLLRTLAGGSESVVMAFAVVIISFVVGISVGLIAGFAGGAVDAALDKIITMFQAFPNFVLAIAIAAVLGQGMVNMIIAIAVVYWTQPARLARSLALSLKDSQAVKAARICGARAKDICLKYLLPNMAPPLIVMAALSIGDVVLTMAGLSFLGLGPERPTNEWGAMMSEARTSFQYAPWGIIVPGVALFCAITIFNLLGDALRDVLDVKTSENDPGYDNGQQELSGKALRKKKGGKMDTRKRKKGVLVCALAFCMAFALLMTGCSSDSSSNADSKELRAGSSAYFYNETLDPAYNWDGWELEYYGVTENLLKLTDDYNIEPWLAESVENVDEYTWTINLRDDVTFSNGEKMTGDSVKACWERTYEVNSRAAETLALESIEADGQTVTVTTSEPVPSFQNVICDPLFCIYYTADGIDYENEGTACTGPYVVTDFVFEDHISLAPNENYWNGDPQLDSITLTTYMDIDSMTMALQNGEIDVIAMPAASAVTTVENDENIAHHAVDSTRVDFIRFNMNEDTHPVSSNDAVRLAVSYCIDRDNYANAICAGTETPSYGVYSSVLPYGGTEGLDVTVDSFDTAAAASALDEAGVVDTDGDGVRELPDGTPCVLEFYNCSQYERFVNLADDLQSKLASVGIQLDITTVDYWLQDAETYNSADPDMTIDSYGMAPTGDANYFASMAFKTGGSANFGNYSNETVDTLIDQLVTTFDQAERDEIAKQISQEVLNDNAYIFFGNSQTAYLASSNVQNIAVAPSEYYFITKDTTVE